MPSLSELLTKSVAELSEEVMTLKLELETERRSCAVLRTGLEQHQRTATDKSKQLVKESKQRLDAQKHEYEAAIARHQSFIDQLIEDKKSISHKCEALTTELRNNERRNKEKKTKINTEEEKANTNEEEEDKEEEKKTNAKEEKIHLLEEVFWGKKNNKKKRESGTREEERKKGRCRR